MLQVGQVHIHFKLRPTQRDGLDLLPQRTSAPPLGSMDSGPTRGGDSKAFPYFPLATAFGTAVECALA